MRILAIHSYLLQKRGAELALFNMVCSLRKRGHDVDVLALRVSEEYAQALRERGVGVVRGGAHSSSGIFSTIRNMVECYRFIKRSSGEYDVALVHHYWLSPMSLPLLKIPRVYYCPEPPRDYYEPDVGGIKGAGGPSGLIRRVFHVLYKRIDAYCVRYADIILSNSHYGKEYIWRCYGILPRTNYLGVDVERFRPLKIKRENIVLSVGALHPRKGHDLVIRAVARIPEEGRPAVVIVGAGSEGYRAWLVELADSLHVNLQIESNLSDADMVELYSRASLVACAYVMEPFGLVAIEAMACETPVVAVSEGGLRESITEETGILTHRDEEEFAEAIRYILEHPEAAERMGRRGRERVVKYFTWERCAQELEKNLMRAVKLHNRGAD
ncbi:glycosyltransferase family 4 protein [Methermicoccus shengliensis]|uniref:glycosyltransferase family 4 protein n=1 Tax=Methermicoccus shengliensis TaxID=660064 RepID=UPI0005B2BA53|nr:glycosyltransferase family 4 protein [Methermicoccus shengliensis]